jgi:hypothetical protein
MEHPCSFCGNVFRRKFNLDVHQRSADYCLRIQGKKPALICIGCETPFKSKLKLGKHEQECVPYLQDKIKKLENEIVELRLKSAKTEVYKEEYLAIRDKPTTTYNNTTTNKLKMVNIATIEPFTLDTVKKHLSDDKYTYKMFLDGALGVKQFILRMITKDDEKNYVATDTNRKNFHRLELARNWVSDKGALFLTKVFDEMKPLALGYFDRFQETVKATKRFEEIEANDAVLDKIMPVMRAIINPEHKDRKTLQDDIIKYIQPHVAV